MNEQYRGMGGNDSGNWNFMQQNEKKALRANASKLGFLLVLYHVLAFNLLQRLYYYLAYFVLAKKFTLRWSTVSAFLGENYYDLVTSTAFGMSLMLFSVLAALAIVLLIARFALKIRLTGMFRFEKEGCKTAMVAFPAFTVVWLASAYLVSIITSAFQNAGVTVPEADFTMDRMDAPTLVIQMLYVVLAGPIAEEVIYRGLILKLTRPFGNGIAVVFSSLIFGLMHSNFSQFINGFFIGLFLGSIAVRYNSIIPTILIHVLNNALSSLSDVANLLNSTLIENIYWTLYISMMLLGILVVFVHIKKAKLPQDGKVYALPAGQRATTLYFNLFILADILVLIYFFVDWFRQVN